MYQDFAALMSYPDEGLFGALDRSEAALAPQYPEAAALLESFRSAAAALGPDALEESYVRTFEMRAEAALYVGHQVFGEDWRRGIFMAGLKQEYQAHGFEQGSELPDHFSVILRFLEVQPDGPEKEELIGDCLVPAVLKVLSAIEDANPYRAVLDALLVFLGPRDGGSEFEEIACRPSSSSLFPILP